VSQAAGERKGQTRGRRGKPVCRKYRDQDIGTKSLGIATGSRKGEHLTLTSGYGNLGTVGGLLRRTRRFWRYSITVNMRLKDRVARPQATSGFLSNKGMGRSRTRYVYKEGLSAPQTKKQKNRNQRLRKPDDGYACYLVMNGAVCRE